MNYPPFNYQGYQNPYAQYQQPLQQMSQAQAQPANSYTCKPVTSREEALGMVTNFTSAGDIMPDLAHGVIYLKRFNPNNGTSEFMEFQYAPPQAPQKPQEYATVQMLNDALEEMRNDIAALSKPRAAKKGGNDE